MATPLKNVSVWMPTTLKDRLSKAAKKKRRSNSAYLFILFCKDQGIELDDEEYFGLDNHKDSTRTA